MSTNPVRCLCGEPLVASGGNRDYQLWRHKSSAQTRCNVPEPAPLPTSTRGNGVRRSGIGRWLDDVLDTLDWSL